MRITIASMGRAVMPRDLVAVVRAIERQVYEDFAPLWAPKGTTVDLRVIERADRALPNEDDLAVSDGVVYVSRLQRDPCRGFPRDPSFDAPEVPWTVIYPDLERAMGEPWTRTFSHEILEMVADPAADLFAIRPHPVIPQRVALRPYEVCAPVSGKGYQIDGWDVANFITPLYYADLPEPVHTRTNFLNLPLDRFGLLPPRGYYTYFDARTGHAGEVCAPGGESAAMLRMALSETRRRVRAKQALRSSRGWTIEETSCPSSGAWTCAPATGCVSDDEGALKVPVVRGSA